jgi:glycosyltransferase involved in cell wall biosynthesis
MNRVDASKPIAFFIPALNGGGAQRVVVNLANALVDIAENPVHVVLVRKEGHFLNFLRHEVTVIDLQGKRTILSIQKLTDYLRKLRPAVIMSSMNYANIICSIAHLFAGKPCRLILREANIVRAPDGSLVNRLMMQTVHHLMRRFYPKSDGVVANSYDTRQSLLDQKIVEEKKIHILGNPIALQKKVETPTDGFENGLPIIAPFICAIGRLSEQKGFDTLIEAFSKIKTQNLHLVILGEGELQYDLKRQTQELGIQERVHMPGFVQNPMTIVEKAKAFVLSSRWEGFGNVLVEALSTGVPIVSTDCPGGPRTILENGLHGHLVAYNDPEALATGILEALSEPAGTPNSRKRRAEEFSAEKIAREYLNRVLLPTRHGK